MSAMLFVLMTIGAVSAQTNNADSKIPSLEVKISGVDELILKNQQFLTGQSHLLSQAYTQFRDTKDRNNRTAAVQLGLKAEIHEAQFRSFEHFDYKGARAAREEIKKLWQQRNSLMSELLEATGKSAAYRRYEVRGIDLKILKHQSTIEANKASFEAARRAFDKRKLEHNNSTLVRSGLSKPIYEVEFRPFDYFDATAMKNAQEKIKTLNAEKAAITAELDTADCSGLLKQNG